VIASLLSFAVRLVAGTQAMWFGSEPSPRQCIYIANHSSHLDFLVLWASLPSSLRSLTRPVAARDYWNASAARRFLAVKVFRALLIDRGSGGTKGDEVLKPMLEALQQGDSLILFPEGTRGSGEEVAAFKSGIYHLCRQVPGLELLPVSLDNLNRILPKGEFLPVPLLSRVHYGSRIVLQPGETKSDFLTRARDAVVSLRNM
jgi:1-acyl-sn-glycerol-3-phosphate acyltransferase